MQINEPINRDKQLNIITIADASDYGVAALHYGMKLAQVFQASLTIISRFGFSLSDNHKEALNIRKHVQDTDNQHNIEIREDYFFPESLYNFAEKKNTIMFVIGVDNVEKKGLFNKKNAIRFIKPSRLPVMTVGKKLPEAHDFQKVVLPIDIERQAKEKALWAGYFSRFYQATILILKPRYKDSGLNKQVSDNIAFVEKLYQNLDISYQIEEIESPQNIDLQSIDYAMLANATLTVITMTKYFTLGDLLLGPKEKKIIGNVQGFPVLCINQRDDLYVLCT